MPIMLTLTSGLFFHSQKMATKSSSIIFSHRDTHLLDEKMLSVMPLNKKFKNYSFSKSYPSEFNCKTILVQLWSRRPDSHDWLSLMKTHLLSLVKCPASLEECDYPQTKSGSPHKEVWERMAKG